jgi:hypothetical protein
MADPRKPAPRLVAQPPARPRPDTHPAHLALHHRAGAELETRRRGTAQSSGVRMVLGLAGLASASALASAMLPSVLPQPTVVTTMDTSAVAADPTALPQPSVIHVTHVITLAPGQTLPPDAAASTTPVPATPTPRATPRPTPRVIIQTVTRQSGKP